MGWKVNLLLAILNFFPLHYLASYSLATADGAQRYHAESQMMAAKAGQGVSAAVSALGDFAARAVVVQYAAFAGMVGQFAVPGAFLLAAALAFFRTRANNNERPFARARPSAERKTQVLHAALLAAGAIALGLWALKPEARRFIPLGLATPTSPAKLMKQSAQGVIYLHPDLLAEFAKAPRPGVLKAVVSRCTNGERDVRLVVGVLREDENWLQTANTLDPLGSPHAFVGLISRLEHGGAVTSRWRLSDRAPLPSDLQSTHIYLGAATADGVPALRDNAVEIGKTLPLLQQDCPAADLSAQVLQARYKTIESQTPHLLDAVPDAVRRNGGQAFYFGMRQADATRAYHQLLASMRDLGSPTTVVYLQRGLRSRELRAWNAGPYLTGAQLEQTNDGWVVTLMGPIGFSF